MSAVPRESAPGHKLDALRAGAALLVCLEHARAVFMRDYEGGGIVARLWYAVTGLGHAAVILFFVLSGFLVGGSVRRAFAEGRWDWRGYGAARLSRLWIVLIPALALGYLWDASGLRLFPGSLLYHGGAEWRLILPRDIGDALSPRILFGNASFAAQAVPVGMDHAPVPPLGSNGPIWSLTFEFGYYLLFPCLLLAARGKWGYGLAALLVAALLGWYALALFPIWLMGAGLATFRPPPSCGRPLVRGLVALLALGCLAVYRVLYPRAPVPFDLLLGGTFVVYLATLLASASDSPIFLRKPVAFLANMSYTLYLVHMPFLVWLAAASGLNARMPFSGAGVSIVIGSVLASVAYAAGVGWLTERRTGELRGWMTRRLAA